MKTTRRGLFGLAAGIATLALVGPGSRPSETQLEGTTRFPELRVKTMTNGGFLVSQELADEIARIPVHMNNGVTKWLRVYG